MPYIFHTKHALILIDSSPKNGVFCQTFSSSSNPKSVQIYPQHITDYSAHMDESGKLYVAIMPDASHLNYYTYEGNRFNRHILIANTNSNYTLSSPILYSLDNNPYIIYLSHQNHSTTYNFVQENVTHSELSTLFVCNSQPTLIKSYMTQSNLYIFFITYDNTYHLNALQINSTGSFAMTYLSSYHPIVDYSICIEDTDASNPPCIHIAYVSELHGQYQLGYFNTHSAQITPLMTTQYSTSPILFCYYNMIWINALINHKLQMLISIDHGQNFSLPAPCSIQNNIHRYYFSTPHSSPFIGQEVYATTTSTLKLCTLAMIDLPHFHPDTVIPAELELLLEGLLLSLDTASTTPPIPKNEPPISSTSSQPNDVPPKSTLKDAKSAFMNELTGWDLPPKI